MATQVKIKRRTADANAPVGLTAGEMAINLVDKKLYVGGTAGTNVIFLDSTSSVGLSTANTFTQLNTFSAGISASGATFTGSISGATATFSKDITVNGMRVGLGGGGYGNNVAVGLDALKINTAPDNTAVGSFALYGNTSGTNNTGVGASALTTNSTGSENTGVGSGALAISSTGSNNTAVGYYALASSQAGSNKTAIGYAAGYYRGTATATNTTGTGGIYIGYRARGSTLAQTNEIVIGVDALGLGSNTAVIGATLQSAATIYGVLNLPSGLSASGATFTGLISGATATFSKDITVNSMTVGLGGGGSISNIALGQGALVANTDGTSNSAIGGSALGNNTEGIGNVALGGSALLSNTIGSNNIAIGSGSMYYATERADNIAIGVNSLNGAPGITGGPDNIAIGSYALTNATSGSSNTGVGTITLRNTTTASQMTALGYAAGAYRGSGALTLTTGTGGIYIGYQARGSANARTNEIVIGADALGLGSNTAVIGATLQSAATIYGLLNLPGGLSTTGATFSGNISAPNIVTSFNGATGTVTGASLGANTFTALNTFSAGISASGATFSGPIISTGYQISSGAINAQTGSYSLVAGDNGKIVTMNVGSGNTLTVPASLAVGFNCTVIQLGAGQTTILASGVTLNSYQSALKISGQHGSASIISYTSNVYNVSGSLVT